MHTLIVKLRNLIRPEDGCARLRSLIGDRDLEGVNQLFPGDTEPETASLMEVTLRDSASVATLLASLQEAADIEYAHEASSRRPMPGRRR